jgi:pantoate--beta-alanine ligase
VSEPVVARTRAELEAALAAARSSEGRLALVPTMGALHAGHASLMKVAREHVGARGAVAASIFVNPLQFGAGEDLDRYPRSFDADLEMCAGEGVDVVFAPTVDEVYPGREPAVTVDPGPDSRSLEGGIRPGHFRGVLTVVAKLFGLVRPDVAVFGEKDYEQLTKIRRMVLDLCMPVEIVGAPIIREPDGLALSSRNRYLDADQRVAALALSRALAAGLSAEGRGADAVVDAAFGVLREVPGLEWDYVTVTSPDLDGTPPSGPARLLVAARLGSTRLLDNTALHLGRSPEMES